MKLTIRLAGVALAMVLAAPAWAEAVDAADAPGADAAAPRVIRRVMILNGQDHGGMPMMGGMFGKLSPEGRDTMRQAMAGGPREVDRAAVDAARKKMLDVLAADRLDVAALRSAMAEERAVAARQQETHQAAMLAAFQKLSVTDRKAFADSMRDMHMHMQMRMNGMGERMKGMHDRMKGMRMMHGDDMPPPPPPPPPGG